MDLLALREVQRRAPQVLQALRRPEGDLMAWPPKRVIIAPANDAERAAVRRAQRALRLSETGEMDEPTKAALRGLQALHKAPVTGVIDPRTVQLVDGLRWQPPEED